MELQKEVYSFASYSLFRKLYDRNSTSEIITMFIESLITERQNLPKQGLQTHEVRQMLFEEYGFQIPHGVIRQCLSKSKLLTRDDNKFYINSEMFQQVKKTQITMIDEIDENNKLIESIVVHIENETGEKLKDDNFAEIIKCLYSFVLEKILNTNFESSKYYQYISSYLIGPSSAHFSKQIESIKEGSILLAGLAFNDSPARQKKWREKFDIFIEMEILFYLAGFNGEIYQEIAQDTFSLIQEINNPRKIINLKCFREIEDNINGFFDKAISIFEKGQKIEATGAMYSIINGCEETTDIIEKRTKFYQLMERNKIEFVDSELISNDIEFNMSSQERIQKFKPEDPKDLDKITQINKIRKNELFYDITKSKAMLLTARGKLSQISFGIAKEEEKKSGGADFDQYDEVSVVPYHTSMWFLSARLWYDLNKGFGNDLPKSLSVVSKAKIMISSLLENKLAKEYDKAIGKYNKGELSEELAIATLANIRVNMVKPEEVNETNVDELIGVLTFDQIDLETQNIFGLRNENQKLRGEVQSINSNIIELESENQKLRLEKEIKSREISELKELAEKTELNEQLKRVKLKKTLVKVLIILVSVAISICYFTFVFGKLSEDNRSIWFQVETYIGLSPLVIVKKIISKANKIFDEREESKRVKVKLRSQKGTENT